MNVSGFLFGSACHIQRRYVPLQWATTKDDMLALTGDRVLDEEKVHLTGFSMGGYIAALWALEHPEQVASLTVIGWDPNGLTQQEIKRRQQLVTMLKKGQFHPDKPDYLRRFIHPDYLTCAQVVDVVRDMGKDLGAATLLAHTEATTPRPSLIKALANAPFPIHFIVGSDDQLVNISAVRTASDSLVNSRLWVIENAAHMSILEQPDIVSQYLQRIWQ
ncbi:alpha/beta hydrolase [Alteromonas sp. 14N.309.X.WAT.G.H12]|uniref:alpha/beta fold hydrolase n=1 Tax=Alteromonas sp. 14N.309.X.WAT.G.H12 TaxID=3120824 RepID=UPI002FD77059